MTTPTQTPNVQLTPERLKDIRTREQAATPGPWTLQNGGSCIHVGSRDGRFSTGCISWDGNGAANAAFIAFARSDIPALLTHLGAVTRERDEARDVLATIAGSWGCDDLIDRPVDLAMRMIAYSGTYDLFAEEAPALRAENEQLRAHFAAQAATEDAPTDQLTEDVRWLREQARYEREQERIACTYPPNEDARVHHHEAAIRFDRAANVLTTHLLNAATIASAADAPAVPLAHPAAPDAPGMNRE